MIVREFDRPRAMGALEIGAELADLIAPDLLVLPAFSPWAAGANVRAGEFLSAYARLAAFEQAIAVLAGKLLPLPMPRRTQAMGAINQPRR